MVEAPSSPGKSSRDGPEDPGALVRREVLVPLKLTGREAADLLDVGHKRFRAMLRGARRLDTATACRIEVVFGLPMERLLPGGRPEALAFWRARAGTMGLSRYRPMPTRRRNRANGPESENGEAFGALLGKVVGIKRGRLSAVAGLLGLDATELSAIIRGRRRPTQVLLRRSALLARLEAAFPEGWRTHGAALTRAARLLPERHRRVRDVLGGKTAD